MPWRQPAPKTNCSCHTFVACLILYLGVLFTYALFADISLFQHVTKLFSKCGISSPFHLVQGFLVSWNPLPIRTFNFMISWGMVSDKVIDVSADWILRVQRFFSPSRLLLRRRWLQSKMTSLQSTYWFGYDSFRLIGNGRHWFRIFS